MYRYADRKDERREEEKKRRMKHENGMKRELNGMMRGFKKDDIKQPFLSDTCLSKRLLMMKMRCRDGEREAEKGESWKE